VAALVYGEPLPCKVEMEIRIQYNLVNSGVLQPPDIGKSNRVNSTFDLFPDFRLFHERKEASFGHFNGRGFLVVKIIESSFFDASQRRGATFQDIFAAIENDHGSGVNENRPKRTLEVNYI
jgi:hypothetical protein